MLNKIYTMIGSRSTPQPILDLMFDIAARLGEDGWILRSGGADGADSAGESGANSVGGLTEIYLPWKGFNGRSSDLYPPTFDAKLRASRIHPGWDRLSQGAALLHARNVHQILGKNLRIPTQFVICWTPGGKPIGGTRTAIVLAEENNIPVYNLAVETISAEQLIEKYSN